MKNDDLGRCLAHMCKAKAEDTLPIHRVPSVFLAFFVLVNPCGSYILVKSSDSGFIGRDNLMNITYQVF